ncbi:DUF4437 domain-containing protein [Planobispora longispora]|uniref:DUF4437 domain-containing protein n=1 Tax=Planobispora longispora TaxID=28887 RepID=A0A8J3W9C0_9ACTN|nr:DUF4437 domain-containing protein [Planobispora longispora]GIH80840.1 hypothetical protein Plo01_72690 [Planobispora longispora]
MRPHVELIHEDDYVWHGAELIGGEGRASERRLSADEEDGSSSLRIDFHTDWSRGPGIHHADSEYYVLDGSMTYGGRRIGPGGYVHAPRGVPAEAIAFAEGSRILHYREYGDAGFDPAGGPGAPRWEGARGDVTVLDSRAMAWDAVPNAGPMPGLFIKYLHVDPATGFYTRLVHAQQGWADHRLAHHPCYEEAYTVQGHMEYNFGTLDLGTYFFRPARVKHGHFTTMEGGATWLLRSDGELHNWYTQNEWVRWGGEAVNYGPGGGRTRWSQSSHDLASGPIRRGERDLADLAASWRFQRERGADDAEYVQHGQGADKSLVAIAKALDAARLQAGHDHDHDRGHTHEHAHDHDRGDAHGVAADWGAGPRSPEHPDERSDAHAHNRGRGRAWKPGDPVPAPIVSGLPVRSRSRGRWDGDGM